MGAADKDKGKKCKVEEEEELDQNEGELLVFIDKLQQVQDELEKVNEEASEKVLEVEQKYNEVRRPVYAKRTEIIKSIPDFWLTAFLSHPTLGDLLNEEDQKIFKYLSTIDVEDFKDLKSGYSITFSFNPNPYFEDEKLTKTFSFTDDVVTATKIKWKEGKDLSNGDNHEKKGNKRPFTEESFFTWFSDGHENDITGGFQDEVADVIKDDLWPNPLRYFNNEADEDFEDEEDDDEEGNGVEEDEDDEDEDVADEKDS